MFRIAVCDDMHDALMHAKIAVQSWPNQPNDMVVELFEDGDSLIDAHTRSPFDIILLDIVMPLLSGMETASEIRKLDDKVKIVFLTSSAEFAVESYEVKANNYLLKPVNSEKLFRCLNEFYNEYQTGIKLITIRSASSIHNIDPQKIEYVEAQGKRVIFSLTTGETLTAYDAFYNYEQLLSVNDGFMKCHRSYIVNVHRISTYTLKEITMQSGCRIPISRGRHKEFEAAYFEMIFGKAD